MLVSVTDASGTTPPEASVASPVMVPRGVWANKTIAHSTRAIRDKRIGKALLCHTAPAGVAQTLLFERGGNRDRRPACKLGKVNRENRAIALGFGAAVAALALFGYLAREIAEGQ